MKRKEINIPRKTVHKVGFMYNLTQGPFCTEHSTNGDQ